MLEKITSVRRKGILLSGFLTVAKSTENKTEIKKPRPMENLLNILMKLKGLKNNTWTMPASKEKNRTMGPRKSHIRRLRLAQPWTLKSHRTPKNVS
jgi:hypothetical protein